jgi:dephospho-CoA kinase
MEGMMAIIGVVGQNGSGKDEVVKYLKEKYDVPFLSSGDIVREIAARKNVEGTRENLSKISEDLFRRHGKGYFMRQIAAKIAQNGWENAGISGIRAPEDVQALKAAFGNRFFLINVYVTNPQYRYVRMRQRGETRDSMSNTEFERQDANEEQLFRISETVKQADVSLSNDRTQEDFHRAIEELIINKALINFP